MRSNYTLHGFTLLEVIISLFILAIVGSLISSGLHSVLENQEHLTQKNKTLSDLQLTNMIIERDIHQAINLSTPNDKGIKPSTLEITEHSIKLIRTRLINLSTSASRNTLQHIRYQLEGDKLIRYSSQEFDKNAGENKQRLLENIQFLQFNKINIAKSNKIGISIEMRLTDLGRVRRVISIESKFQPEDANE